MLLWHHMRSCSQITYIIPWLSHHYPIVIPLLSHSKTHIFTAEIRTIINPIHSLISHILYHHYPMIKPYQPLADPPNDLPQLQDDGSSPGARWSAGHRSSDLDRRIVHYEYIMADGYTSTLTYEILYRNMDMFYIRYGNILNMGI